MLDRVRLRAFVFIIVAVLSNRVTARVFVQFPSLGLHLLGQYHLVAGICVKLARHEILVGVNILVQIDNLFNSHGVWSPLHRVLGELARLSLADSCSHLCFLLFD